MNGIEASTDGGRTWEPWPLDTAHPAQPDLYHGRNLNAARRQAEYMTVILAWQAGELTEGSAARYLELDRLELRRLRDESIQMAVQWWDKYREVHPVNVEGLLP